MLRLHQSERYQFERIFLQEEKKDAPELLRLLEAFLSREEHLTANELYDIYAADGGTGDPDFVQHALDSMVKYGFAHKIALKDQPVRYEHRHLGAHHDHMVCIKCGKIQEFYLPELESLQDHVARAKGFQNLQHRLEIYGLCRECSVGRSAVARLSDISPGDRVIVDGFEGDKGAQFRLISMGLNPGVEVELISNNGGPVVVAQGGNRLAIGRALSAKIIVRAKD